MNDPRHIENGWQIPHEHYCDQPYVVITRNGNWLCTMTTGLGVEGEPGQHIVATISADMGRSWGELIDLEPAAGPEASWVMPLIVPSGRVYVFYTYNRDNLREVKFGDDGMTKRVDTLGVYAFKFSDDNGRSWSARHEIPVRDFEIDRENPYQGTVRFFWGVGKPIIHAGAMYFGFAKVGRLGAGFMESSEGCLIKSDNILTEPDPEKLHWETLPAGDIGLRAPCGPVADEHNPVGLADGSLFCTYRSTDGHPCHAYSRDGGHTWTPPAYMSYEPGGRLVKHPRAANFVKKFANGKYLYWFHNHGGRDYIGRNPVWLSGGVEHDGPDGKVIHWSQPEILLYDDDPATRISYPDFIEDAGEFFFTETQKEIARVHRIDRSLLEGLWNQGGNRTVAADGLALEMNDVKAKAKIEMPRLGSFSEREGFSLDFWITFKNIEPNQVLFDSRAANGNGVTVTLTDPRSLKITLKGPANPGGPRSRATLQPFSGYGSLECAWESDPGLFKPGKPHHVSIIVDGGPKIITFVVDGLLCDGGKLCPAGWGRFAPWLWHVNGADEAVLAPALNGSLACFRLYTRALRSSEAVGNFHAGPKKS